MFPKSSHWPYIIPLVYREFVGSFCLKCMSIVAPSWCKAKKIFDHQHRTLAGLIILKVALHGYLCIQYNQFAILS